DGAHGPELWRTDGSFQRTLMIANVRPAADAVGPAELTNAGGLLFFTDDDGTSGRELWLAGPDVTPPNPPVTPACSPDTGTVGDRFTSASSLVLQGTTDDRNNAIQLFDGSTLLGSTDPAADGTWSFATAPLPDGTHTFSAVAVDEADLAG